MSDDAERRPEGPPSERDLPPRDPGDARRYSAREVGGAFIALLGVGIVASGLVINPFVGRLVQGPHVVDKADVLLGYFLWSLALGAGVVALGTRVAKRSGASDAAVAFLLPLVFLVLADRLLLVQFGLPLWTFDPDLRYRHRPGIERTLARDGRADERIRINRFGHHDTEFDAAKPPGELRGLMLGDSITMGDQLPYAETFSAQLEALLAEGDRRHASHEMINTGVHGYATWQELGMLREALRFDPDFVVVGFCMNDLTEPSVVERDGGPGEADYHGVAPSSNPVQGWLLNDTGIGRLAQTILARSRTGAGERLREAEAVRDVAARGADDPAVAETWRWVEQDLEAIYALADERGIPVVLLIFPFTFQLADPGLQRPQEILLEHAARHGVDAIDFTPIFAERVYADGALLDLLRRQGYDDEAIERVFLPQTRRYFLDRDHLSEAGHRVVAERLFEYLRGRGLVGSAAGEPSPGGRATDAPTPAASPADPLS